MIDLHTHTTASDGTTTPGQLISMDRDMDLFAVAITDHETVDGVKPAMEAAQRHNQRFVPGVEISAEFSPGTMHIVGLGINPENPVLREKLKYLTDSRVRRVRDILKLLNKLDIKIDYQSISAKAQGVPGRPHIATVMVEKGYVKNMNQAFKKYLSWGKPAYIKRRKFVCGDIINAIHAAQGLAILAHPYTLELTNSELKKMLVRLKQEGLDGVEGYYSTQPRTVSRLVRKEAEILGLLVSGGSDFHGETMPEIKLGRGCGDLNVPDSLWKTMESRLGVEAG
jgi:predicted metal-dependent phosphoesterase TrpH